eukprot:snap_masked-scaffold_1-processed-gene-9.44-mRNA-1 protein AED:0.03 eAED:0.03 QI:0/-1/0/1/-1/1/1/0/421
MVKSFTILNKNLSFPLAKQIKSTETTLDEKDTSINAVEQKASEIIGSGEEDAFVVINLSDLKQKIFIWNESFPSVKPYYAIKCNNDERIVQFLKSRGLNFDCASLNEVQQVNSTTQNISNRIIYANPCKSILHLQKSFSLGVSLTVFDSFDELLKIKQYCPMVNFLLRIETDDSKSTCKLSQKYGAKIKDVNYLYSKVKDLGLEDNFHGLSYHVGSGCPDSDSYVQALLNAKSCFDIAEKEFLFPNFKILDIGGGFPGELEDVKEKQVQESFFSIAKILNPLIERLFGVHDGYEVIAEPGRFFAHSCCTLFTNIIARKKETEHMKYFINEGVYGAFNNIIYDHAVVKPEVFETREELKSREFTECSIWGPTCDGLDCVVRSVQLPVLEIGDWLCFRNMGAYTISAGSEFNGFERTKRYYIE